MDDEDGIAKSINTDEQSLKDTDSTPEEKKTHLNHKTNGNLTPTKEVHISI